LKFLLSRCQVFQLSVQRRRRILIAAMTRQLATATAALTTAEKMCVWLLKVNRSTTAFSQSRIASNIYVMRGRHWSAFNKRKHVVQGNGIRVISHTHMNGQSKIKFLLQWENKYDLFKLSTAVSFNA